MVNAKIDLSFYKRKIKRKTTAFSRRAFSPDLAMMRVNNRFDVAKPQTKSFNVVNVSGVGAIEFFENAVQRFFVHANSVIFYFYSQMVVEIAGS